MTFNGYEYRFLSARGLERRPLYSRIFEKVSGADFEKMTWQELEHCSRVMRASIVGASEPK